ncbi:methyl-accepting chemotaxis sensory transducer [Caballeronia humi]|uniref:Methyl-accepting chemotaxis sensory transducer n=1 Tax=Caballeronia humi TaxID=326474 RepID=A0A158FTS2_9BURK|nr:methyl-accepting chemotaxis sensory transducer [Caballeronia humi]
MARAVTQMDEVTQQNAALVEEAAAAAQSLEDQAGRLRQVVSVFQLNESGAAPVAPARSKASPRPVARKPAVAAPAKRPMMTAPRTVAPAAAATASGDWETF